MGLLATHPTESEPESGDLTDEQILCLIGAALALTACLATCVDPCPEENEKCIADCNLKYVLRVASCLSGSGFGFDDEE
jgi:hypothetical protein